MALTSPLAPGRTTARALPIATTSEVRRVQPKRGNIGIGPLLRGWQTAWIRRAHLRRDQEIARYIAAHGGVMTDELDRSISRHFGQL